MDVRPTLFAHSLPNKEASAWEPLSTHAASVGQVAAARAASFGWEPAGRALGLLHDVGKASAAFQAYLRAGPAAPTKVDHSTAGARLAQARFGVQLGRLLAFAVAGHHAGLPDADDLTRRLDPGRTPIPDFSGWENVIALPAPRELEACRRLDTRDSSGRNNPAFVAAFLTRMLFSCLVDADFVETERFYAEAAGEPVPRGAFTPLATLADRLRQHLATMRRDDTPVNRLRSRVLDHATEKAFLPPGLFTLTVPTGGGKTLTSLSWALEHACAHGLRRVIYVIPYTSIIEQTASIFRTALGDDAGVLEHHASFDWETALRTGSSDAEVDSSERHDALGRLRRAAENWDAPVIVTTAVQFLKAYSPTA